MKFRGVFFYGTVFAASAIIGACSGADPSFSKVNASQQATVASASDSSSSGTARSGDDGGAADESCDRPDIDKETDVVRICHVPSGNPAAQHTICPSREGAINGHGLDPAQPSKVGGHGGDRWGDC